MPRSTPSCAATTLPPGSGRRRCTSGETDRGRQGRGVARSDRAAGPAQHHSVRYQRRLHASRPARAAAPVRAALPGLNPGRLGVAVAGDGAAHRAGVYPSLLAEPATLLATDAWLSSADPVPALRRLVVEGRDGVARALRNQERDRAAQRSRDALPASTAAGRVTSWRVLTSTTHRQTERSQLRHILIGGAEPRHGESRWSVRGWRACSASF